MKTLKFLFIGVLIAAAMTSCNSIWDFEDPYTFDPTPFNKSKIYRGGNVECYQLNLGLDETTGRNDYDPANGGFQFAWPEGLFVKVENGTEVSFFMAGPIKIAEKCYEVGAVIVKGGDGSNVYLYDDGATKDKNMVSPNNASGSPAGLSNLTFCFVEVDCEAEEKPVVIAIKSFFWPDSLSNLGYDWAGSAGSDAFKYISSNWCYSLGVSSYPETPVFSMMARGNVVGNATVTDIWTNGVHYLVVKVDLILTNGIMDKTYLYVGTMEGLLGDLDTDNCPKYENWRSDLSNSTTHTFVIPFSEIN